MFRREFKNNVKNEFMRYKNKFKNMNILIEVMIEFDDKLYERIMKKRYHESREKFNIYVDHNTNFRNEKSRFDNKSNNIHQFNNYETTSIKLNFTQRRKNKILKKNKITKKIKRVIHVTN